MDNKPIMSLCGYCGKAVTPKEELCPNCSTPNESYIVDPVSLFLTVIGITIYLPPINILFISNPLIGIPIQAFISIIFILSGLIFALKNKRNMDTRAAFYMGFIGILIFILIMVAFLFS